VTDEIEIVRPLNSYRSQVTLKITIKFDLRITGEGGGGRVADDDLTVVMITDLGCEKQLIFNSRCWNRNVRTHDSDVYGIVFRDWTIAIVSGLQSRVFGGET